MTPVLNMRGPIDHEAVDRLAEQLAQLIAEGHDAVLIDLSGVSRTSAELRTHLSAALRWTVDHHAQRIRLRVLTPHPYFHDALESAGIPGLELDYEQEPGAGWAEAAF